MMSEVVSSKEGESNAASRKIAMKNSVCYHKHVLTSRPRRVVPIMKFAES